MKIFAALRDHINEGSVWLQITALPARSIVKITNIESGKSIYCEALQIDPNFLAEYNKKGDPIIIEGRFKQNQWEGKDGKKQSEIVVIANRVHYLKEKDRSGEQGQNQGQTRKGNPKTEAGEPNEQHDETVPFSF